MGFRTTVILYNDQASQWENDPALGKRIAHAMNHALCGHPSADTELGYGRVVECTHADNQTLAVLDSYSFRPVSFGLWQPEQQRDAVTLKLLKEAASRLGYKLIKDNSK